MTHWTEIQRREARVIFESLPFPTDSDDNFRFLPSASVNLPSRGAIPPSSAAPSPDDGFFWTPGAVSHRETGFSVEDLSESEVESSIPDEWKTDLFAAHALAEWSSGTAVSVRGSLKKPIRLVRTGVSFRSVLQVEPGASAHIIEELEGDSETVTGVIEVRVKRDARLRLMVVQNYSKATNYFLRLRVAAESGSEVTVVPVFTGGEKGQLRLDAWCEGPGASVKVRGVSRGRGKQGFDFWLNSHHVRPNGESEMDFRMVMDDESRGVFNGLIDITREGIQTQAGQKCRTLLLGPKASVHAIPKLLIATDQVKCGHGASVATVNPEQIHYLQARGIDRTTAEKMIVAGFLEEVLQEIGHFELHERLAERLGTHWENRQ